MLANCGSLILDALGFHWLGRLAFTSSSANPDPHRPADRLGQRQLHDDKLVQRCSGHLGLLASETESLPLSQSQFNLLDAYDLFTLGLTAESNSKSGWHSRIHQFHAIQTGTIRPPRRDRQYPGKDPARGSQKGTRPGRRGIQRQRRHCSKRASRTSHCDP